MPFINLIEEQRLAIKRAERKARSFFLLFAGTAVASVLGFGLTMYQSDALRNEEATLNAGIQKVAPLLKQIEDCDRQRSQVEPRLKTLEDAQLVSQRWDRILHHVATQTPDKVWLTGLRCTSSDPTQPINVTFSGLALAQEPVGEFILRMQNSADLENIQLKFTQPKLINETEAIEFQFDAGITGTAEQLPKNEEAGDQS